MSASKEELERFVAVVGPHMIDAAGRQSIVEAALTGCNVLSQLNWSGNQHTFTVHLYMTLAKFGQFKQRRVVDIVFDYIEDMMTKSFAEPAPVVIASGAHRVTSVSAAAALMGDVYTPFANYISDATDAKSLMAGLVEAWQDGFCKIETATRRLPERPAPIGVLQILYWPDGSVPETIAIDLDVSYNGSVLVWVGW